VIVTTGGKAAPKQGTDGSGYPLLKGLGHTCTRLYPCLVPLRCKGSFFKSLKGIRTQCAVSLYQGKKRLGTERGELQFTDYGVSGIPVFQISCMVTEQNEAAIDFLPDWSYDDTRQEVQRRLRLCREEPVEDALLGLLHKRMQYVLLKQAGLDPVQPCGSVTKSQQDRLISALKGWRLTVEEPLGWEQAQVTGGGVPLREIRADFSSRKANGLYLAGEVLDVAGICGGYNLHWAWCSGMEAGRSAARE
jgi:predicted Rossmann fold flavoprotein